MASKMGVFSKMVVGASDTTKSDGFSSGVIDDIIGIKLDLSSPISSPMINNHIDDSNENSIDNQKSFLKFEQIDEPRTITYNRNSHINDDDSNEIMLPTVRTNENTNFSDEIILVSSNSIDLDDNYYDINARHDINDCKHKSLNNSIEKYSNEQNENFKDHSFLIDSSMKDRHPRRQRVRKNLKPNSNFKGRTKLSIQPTMISNQLFTQSQSEIARIRLHKSTPQKNFKQKKFHIFKNSSNGES
jgi:hypothetical protein